MYDGGQIYVDSNMEEEEKQGWSDHFPEGSEYKTLCSWDCFTNTSITE